MSETKTQAPPRRRLSVRRRWLFRLCSIALALLPFMLFEGALRWLDIGDDTRLIIRGPNTTNRTEFQLNPAVDRIYYGRQDLSGPDPRPFAIPKPEGTFRIVVIGGSTVVGFPYPFELAMPRMLELALNQQQAEHHFEVINAGITAISSISEVDLVRQVIACSPDLIIVHSGHNEFYGPGGTASNFGTLAPRLEGAMRTLRSQRSFQFVTSLLHQPTSQHLMESLPANIAIPLNGPVFDDTMQRYRANLKRLIVIAQQAGTPIVISTVPSNLRDMAPLQPSQNERVIQELRDSAKHFSYGEYELALSLLIKARERSPASPMLAYRQGQCFETLGQTESAGEAYRLAADLDGCRLRAARPLLQIVHEVANTSGVGVYFCDVAAKLQLRSTFPALGSDFFLEHVHYNLEGNWQVATILANAVLADVLHGSWRDDRVPVTAARDKLLDVTPLDYLAADSLTMIVLDAWPFSLSPERKHEVNALRARLSETYRMLAPIDRNAFESLSMSAMEQNLWFAMGAALLNVGENDRAREAFERHFRRRPFDLAGYSDAATALESQGMLTEAEDLRERRDRVKQGG
jgi:Tetratricopeptide repeat